ncbi:hypothetical protein E4U24_000841 [Claviceps purpurea]|nr:hypothetical protein E4U51_005810 [Claviceps purpurea]KAG6236153.1 hypothetical protein E4U25_004059 [Claviceps purpurea]KAG6236480.1 hypothetical protein E4U23_000271 [Claviceps purpurea]KAG6252034.1 hypothetical protein E4U24_000841 [Claviceps purpurea]KAG6311753.1 hypothetical protein E4U44_003901 [Claviceps purpurea]
MKFSTIVGTFALSTLEAYRAYASPVDSVAPAGQSLEERAAEAIEYCCVLIVTSQSREAKFVAWNGQASVVPVAKIGECELNVFQTDKSPSKGGCAEWGSEISMCPFSLNPTITFPSASVCQHK